MIFIKFCAFIGLIYCAWFCYTMLKEIYDEDIYAIPAQDLSLLTVKFFIMVVCAWVLHL